MNIESLTQKAFEDLPLVVEGESKEVRYAGNGEVVIRLKPTIYSYTHNRTGEIPGSDKLRLRSIKGLMPILKAAGVEHTYRQVNDKWILSELVLQPELTDGPAAFRPGDMTNKQIDNLPKAPPIEVVGKRVHSGTPKHRYYQFGQHVVRASHPKFAGYEFGDEAEYPEPIIRFDWRNPMHDENGQRLADEVLSETTADWFIDVEAAKQTASSAFKALSEYLTSKGLDLWDICFFITEDGRKLFGEVSPDCLRVRAKDGSPLDKDVWRSGGSSEQVMQKWQQFVEIIEGEYHE